MLCDPWPWKKFERWEFECKCGCGYDTVDAALVNMLLDIKRNFDGATVIVNSGCRCTKYNMHVGGTINSQHLDGRAADIVVVGVESITVYAYLCGKYPGVFGFGLYPTFTHVDSRSGPSWRKE